MCSHDYTNDAVKPRCPYTQKIASSDSCAGYIFTETPSAPHSPNSKRKRKRQRHKHGEDLPELSLPLLNLHGPPTKAEDEDVGGEDGENNNIRQVATAADDVTYGSPRRKKKRRRGKGKGTGTGLGQNSEGGHGVET